jgi:uncharacterized protein
MRDDHFEWDDRKAASNARKHDVTFELARRAFDDPQAIDWLDEDEQDEERALLTGMAGNALLTVCYVERGPRKRIISARKATKVEQETYFRENR